MKFRSVVRLIEGAQKMSIYDEPDVHFVLQTLDLTFDERSALRRWREGSTSVDVEVTLARFQTEEIRLEALAHLTLWTVTRDRLVWQEWPPEEASMEATRRMRMVARLRHAGHESQSPVIVRVLHGKDSSCTKSNENSDVVLAIWHQEDAATQAARARLHREWGHRQLAEVLQRSAARHSALAMRLTAKVQRRMGN